MSVWRRGRRLFTAASMLLLLVAAAHTVGHWPLLVPDHVLSGALQAMADERSPLGLGMVPSMLDIHRSLVLTMTVTLIALAAFNLLAASAADDALLRRVLWLNVGFVSSLVVLYAFYRVPPPLLSFALVAFVLILALPRARTRARNDA